MAEMKKSPVTDSRFGHLSQYFIQLDEEIYEFNNGLVRASSVCAWDDGALCINEWCALGPLRSGHTRRSLQQLRAFFTNIEVSGIFDKDDPEAPAAWYCWQSMLNEGLIDAAYTMSGEKLKKSDAQCARPMVRTMRIR